MNRKFKFEVLNSLVELNKVLLVERSIKQTFYSSTMWNGVVF